MSASRIYKLVENLVRCAPNTSVALEKISVPLIQGRTGREVIVHCKGPKEAIYSALYASLYPFFPGDGMLLGDRTISRAASSFRDLEHSPWASVVSLFSPGLSNLLNCGDPECWFLHLETEEPRLEQFTLRTTLKQTTWLGLRCLPKKLQAYNVEIQSGALKFTLAPETVPALLTSGNDSSLLSLFQTSQAVEFMTVRYLQSFDVLGTIKIPVSEIISLLGRRFQEYYGYDPKLDLEADLFLLEPIEARKGFTKLITQQEELNSYLEKRIQLYFAKAVQQKAQEISARRNYLSARRSIYVTVPGSPAEYFGYEPHNENEVLILLGKLERILKTYFSTFAIHEHTSLAGIDGLITIKRTAQRTEDVLATAEFEYELVNFFSHRHPFYLTDYIICWALGEGIDSKIRGIRSQGYDIDLFKVIGFTVLDWRTI